MARSSGRRGGGRSGRGGRILTVRQAPYSLPITEPCNFLECTHDVNIPSTGGSRAAILWSDIAEAIADSTGVSTSVGAAAMSFGKLRITSIVMDPITDVDGGADAAELLMRRSGNRYESGDMEKPLRVKLSSEYTSDGQWFRQMVIQKSAAGVYTVSVNDLDTSAAGTVDISDNAFCTIQSGSASNKGWSTELHFRIAWTDANAVD